MVIHVHVGVGERACFLQAGQTLSCFSIVPRSADRPMLLVAGMVETAGLEIFARMENKVHEALIKAEFCAYLQVI